MRVGYLDCPKKLLFRPWSAFLALLAPSQAWATQVHVPSEGLYAHQIAHIFFALSMAILLYWLNQRQLVRLRGWRFIQLSALFFILWNLDAFVVHILDERGDLFHKIDAETWHAAIEFDKSVEWLAILYYIGKMDHLWCVPAMILLYLGLRDLLRASQAGGPVLEAARMPSQDGNAPLAPIRNIDPGSDEGPIS